MMPLSLPIMTPPPSAPRSCDDARGRPRWRARRRRPRIADRPSAAARRSSCGSAPSRHGRRRRSSSSPGSGAYSATASPALAGTSIAMPRAWPSFSVAAALVLTKVASTAASCGAVLLDHREQPVVDRNQPLAQRRRGRWSRPSRRRRGSAGCRRTRSGPSRCGGAPDRCRECESGAGPWPC